MELDSIVEKAQIAGYNIEKGSEESTIQTKNWKINVVLNEGKGQAHCYLGKNQIQLFKENENVIEDLVHEVDHFKIFPYDLISFGVLWGSAFAYSMYKVSQTNDWQNALLISTMSLAVIGAHGIMGGLNLIGDEIIHVREKFGLNRK